MHESSEKDSIIEEQSVSLAMDTQNAQGRVYALIKTIIHYT